VGIIRQEMPQLQQGTPGSQGQGSKDPAYDDYVYAARSLKHCRLSALVPQATADSVPLQTPGTASAPTAKGSSGSSSSSSDAAVYIKAPVAAGATLEYPDSSVVVLGDVPQSARIRAGGDIIVMGT
jgi:septum formation inhibitor MinC